MCFDTSQSRSYYMNFMLTIDVLEKSGEIKFWYYFCIFCRCHVIPSFLRVNSNCLVDANPFFNTVTSIVLGRIQSVLQHCMK